MSGTFLDRLYADANAVRAGIQRWRAPLLAIGLMALTGSALAQRWGGLNPYSLWLDDQWVVALVKHATLNDLVELGPPTPVGFVVVLKAFDQVGGSGTWRMQLLPFVLGLAQIPLLGWLAFRMTGLASLGMFAATLLAGSRFFAVYSLRTKQFVVESFITLLLIALAMMWLRRRRRARLAVLLALAVLVLPVSFTAAFVGLVIVNGLLVHILLDRTGDWRGSRHLALIGGGLYDALALTWIVLYQSGQASPALVRFWQGYYLPLDDFGAAWGFLTTRVSQFLTGALPDTLAWLAMSVPVAIVLLLCRRPTRTLGGVLALFYGGMLAASALHLYPLGGRRTDIFSYPITILAITAALWAIGRRWRVVPIAAVVVAVTELLLLFPRAPIGYPPSPGRAAVELADDLAHEADAIVIAPHANWAVGCYGRWPVRLGRAPELTNGFFVEVDRPGTLVLRELLDGVDYRADRKVVHKQLEGFMQGRPRRVLFITLERRRRTDEWIAEAIRSHGYTSRPVGAAQRGLRLFEIDESSAAPAGAPVTSSTVSREPTKEEGEDSPRRAAEKRAGFRVQE